MKAAGDTNYRRWNAGVGGLGPVYRAAKLQCFRASMLKSNASSFFPIATLQHCSTQTQPFTLAGCQHSHLGEARGGDRTSHASQRQPCSQKHLGEVGGPRQGATALGRAGMPVQTSGSNYGATALAGGRVRRGGPRRARNVCGRPDAPGRSRRSACGPLHAGGGRWPVYRAAVLQCCSASVLQCSKETQTPSFRTAALQHCSTTINFGCL